jgi:hypothetical protein
MRSTPWQRPVEIFRLKDIDLMASVAQSFTPRDDRLARTQGWIEWGVGYARYPQGWCLSSAKCVQPREAFAVMARIRR